jgi:hypothetical protein
MLLAAILFVGVLVLWPFMRRLHAIDACLDRGDFWDYSAHRCVPPVNPHPTAADSAASNAVKRPIVPPH